MKCLLLAVGLAVAGCQEEPAASMKPVPVVEPVRPRVPVAVAAAEPVPPAGVPPAALPWKRVLLQEIQFYWGMNQDPAVFFGQVHQESRWKPEATSKYAGGLSQFTPPTAEWIQGLYAADLRALCPSNSGCPYDPRWALRAMVLYDKRLYGGFGAATGDERWAFTLLGYNGGLGWVHKEQKAAADQGFDSTRYFGQVELVCVRADWACTESRGYPKIILGRWRALYAPWVRA